MIFGPTAHLPLKHSTHSAECKLVEPKQMGDLDLVEQDYVLRCHHWAHDATKLMYREKKI